MSLLGLHVLQRWLLMQYGRDSSVMHSVSLAQPRHMVGVTVMLQMGAVGVVQSAASFVPQPPHSPLAVQTSAPGQLSFAPGRQASQVNVVALQIGVAPLQPELFPGSQATQLPCRHWLRPPGWPWQSSASSHCTQLAVRPFTTQ
jgi:hypothetical protein